MSKKSSNEVMSEKVCTQLSQIYGIDYEQAVDFIETFIDLTLHEVANFRKDTNMRMNSQHFNEDEVGEEESFEKNPEFELDIPFLGNLSLCPILYEGRTDVKYGGALRTKFYPEASFKDKLKRAYYEGEDDLNERLLRGTVKQFRLRFKSNIDD